MLFRSQLVLSPMENAQCRKACTARLSGALFLPHLNGNLTELDILQEHWKCACSATPAGSNHTLGSRESLTSELLLHASSCCGSSILCCSEGVGRMEDPPASAPFPYRCPGTSTVRSSWARWDGRGASTPIPQQGAQRGSPGAPRGLIRCIVLRGGAPTRAVPCAPRPSLEPRDGARQQVLVGERARARGQIRDLHPARHSQHSQHSHCSLLLQGQAAPLHSAPHEQGGDLSDSCFTPRGRAL